MCGITGIYSFNKPSEKYKAELEQSVLTLKKRGPDNQETYFHKKVGLGHARLSIIDTSEAANQPFHDVSGRYTIIFNGEIYNYKEIRKNLEKKGYAFQTDSDTEALLYHYIDQKEKGLEELNGFFAFAIYDHTSESIFIARDKIGIKPLYYYQDDNSFIFASELKAITCFNIKKEIDKTSVMQYLQLCYIPEPYSIFKDVKKLPAGHSIKLSENKFKVDKFYSIPFQKGAFSETNHLSSFGKEFYSLMHSSVEKRLISDVPIGAFLSGGVDSSIIVACASKYKSDLNTFSIGYKDEPLYDETAYAEKVAKHFKTNHTTFKLSNDDLFENMSHLLNYIDEPFADSSALAVNILCQQTKKKATVALSGDGGDELFAGYNKHRAEYLIRNPNWQSKLANLAQPALNFIPQSRSSKWGNKARQLKKFNQISQLNPTERYWALCCFSSLSNSKDLAPSYWNKYEFEQRKSEIIKTCNGQDFNEFLLNDMQLVLVNDMLVKVDRMSMSHSLEVRVPFLDSDIVDFAFQLHAKHKIDPYEQKKILRSAFEHEIPSEIFQRTKHGFEVPLLKWFRNELKDDLNNKWFQEDKIKEQGIFSYEVIQALIHKLNSNNPEDSPLDIWKLIVFQEWYDKYL